MFILHHILKKLKSLYIIFNFLKTKSMSDNEDPIFKKDKKQKQTQQQPTKNLQQVEKLQVFYCGNCSFPLEYCELSKNPIQCKSWLEINNKELFAKLYPVIVQEQQQQQAPAPQEQQQQEKPAKKKRVKVSESLQVKIRIKQRTQKKHITTIEGLQNHNIDLKDAQKKMSKKFGCGSNLNGEIIELQGDLGDLLEEWIPVEYPQIKEDYLDIKQK
ncbi:hypothetical protein pb186bvf_003670 [Paramecium bursaria]